MAISLDMDLGDLVQLIRSRLTRLPAAKEATTPQSRPGTHTIPFAFYLPVLLAGLFLLLASLGIWQWTLSPRAQTIAKHQETLEKRETMQQEMVTLKAQHHGLKQKREQARPTHQNMLADFAIVGKPDTLYHVMSQTAETNGITLASVKPAATLITSQERPELHIQRVALKLEGTYAQYMLFRQQLVTQYPLLHVHKEHITSDPRQPFSGKIEVQLTLDRPLLTPEYQHSMQHILEGAI